MRKWYQSTPLSITLLVLIWGLSFMIYKVALTDSPPWLFAGLRTIAGGLFILPFALRQRSELNLRQNWPIYFWSCVFNVLLFFGLQTIGLADLPAGLFSVLIYLEPVLVGLMAWLWLNERMTGWKVVGLLLGFAGVATISADSLISHLSVTGTILGIVCAFTWAIGTIYTKKVQHKVNLYWLLVIQFLFGGVTMTGIGTCVESWSAIVWHWPLWIGIIYAGFFGIGLSWILWFQLVRDGETTRIAAFTFVVPLISVVASVLFLSEPFTWQLVAGLVFIIVGIYLVNRTPKQAVPPSDREGASPTRPVQHRGDTSPVLPS